MTIATIKPQEARAAMAAGARLIGALKRPLTGPGASPWNRPARPA